MHVSNEDTAPWLDKAMLLLPECRTFYAESPLDELRAWTPEPPIDFDLKEELGAREYKRYRSLILTSMSLDIERFRYANPFWITALMSMKVLGAQGPGMDELLWSQAEDLGLTTRGVESAAAHRAIFQQLNPQDQVTLLRKSASNLTKFRKLHRTISHLYKLGDLHALYRHSYKSLGKQRDLMIRHRNPVMLDKIMMIMVDDQPALISVGVAHLGGYHGVLRSLVSRGVRCEPILQSTH